MIGPVLLSWRRSN